MKTLNIGLFGFGNVGRGLYDVLQRINSQSVSIRRICVRDLNKERRVALGKAQLLSQAQSVAVRHILVEDL